MFSNEAEALHYIDTHTSLLLSEMKEQEMKIVYMNENAKIKILKNNKNIYKFVTRYGDADITDVFKEMIDLRLM